MATVCPVAEPARLFASSPAIGHACSLTRIRVEAADGTAELCLRCAASLEFSVLPLSRRIQSRRHRQPKLWAAAFYVRRFTSMLEPALCARKEDADHESLSTTERKMNESLSMRSLKQSIRIDSLHTSSASSIPNSTTFPNGIQGEVTANNALQRTAPGCHGSCYSRSGVSPSSHLFTSSGAPSASHLRSYRASPPRSLSFGSLAELRPADPPKDFPIATPTPI